MPVLKYLDPVSGTYKALASPPTVTDSDWVSLAPAAGSGTLQYRILGSLIWIRGALTGLSVTAGASQLLVAVGGVPAANRPIAMAYYAIANLGGAVVGQVVVNTDGSVALWNSWTSTVNVCRFIIGYPANNN